ncbi:aminotransferase class V-fold PLP-dependent enzyme [Acidiphilium sp. PA]|uniref:cysteine desulfurase family protein n=1 Tax=Acidiphilium sp. PA TaxID=2871705 RepID=UPI0022436561|nr:aminotransferase class V-fold PLP-dependent enzyme [Acidiphilium sp. PA]MCW8307437.1 aminotransferase class V-fold PLP-dependent enzyme [Acidiphilium sp. PA]
MSASHGADPLYLDANATEPLRPEARAALIGALDLLGNPASIHAEGRNARRCLEAARTTVADRFGARPQDVVFCSGATEANAMAIHAFGATRPIVIGATEHDAVRAAAPVATIMPVDTAGLADLAWLEAELAARPGALVCVMAANNETGVLSPLAQIAAICAGHGALLHVDAVQAAGRILIDYLALGATSVAISAHKLGGPKGVGALILAPAAAAGLPALIAGGGQEQGRRGGTPALPAIAGFAAAITAADPAEGSRQTRLRDAIEAGVRDYGAVVIGAGAPRLPNTTCLALPGLSAETQVIALDLERISVSAGSACSSGKVARSHVLTAMGLHDLAGCAIRVSLPWNAPDDAPARFLLAYRALAARALRKRSGFSNSRAAYIPSLV